MKKVLTGLAVVALALGCASVASAGNVDSSCSYRGKRLYGKVKVVDGYYVPSGR